MLKSLSLSGAMPAAREPPADSDDWALPEAAPALLGEDLDSLVTLLNAVTTPMPPTMTSDAPARAPRAIRKRRRRGCATAERLGVRAALPTLPAAGAADPVPSGGSRYR